jgi:hypothetical protein
VATAEPSVGKRLFIQGDKAPAEKAPPQLASRAKQGSGQQSADRAFSRVDQKVETLIRQAMETNVTCP